MEADSEQIRDTVVLIPAYNPDERLLALLQGLGGRFCRLVLVDDGSVSGRDVLDRASGLVEKVLHHSENRGKGAALKTGFGYIGVCDVITADADGQHRPEDIVRIAEALKTHRDGLVLGVRAFAGKVPLRSRFGNFCTRWLFFLMTRMQVSDTQTGLRGIPAGLVSRIAAIPGDRYEFEMAMLADAKNHAHRPFEVPIETVYLEGNASSHFNPLLDAFRIYRTLFQFCISSVLGFLLDNVVYALMVWWLAGGGLTRKVYAMLALGVARVISSHFNYLYNRFVVFRHQGSRPGKHRSYCAYMGLVVLIGLSSYAFTAGLSAIFDIRGLAMTGIKVCVDLFLFITSYWVQRHFVFRQR